MEFILECFAFAVLVADGISFATSDTGVNPFKQSALLPSAFDEIININSRISSFKKRKEHQQQRVRKSLPNNEGRRLFEADIVMTKDLESYLAKQKNDKKATNDVINHGQWPRGVVPYAFESGFRYKPVVEAAIKHYHEKSCIKFVPRTTETHYINFVHGEGCWSSIGYYGGEQYISLGYGCGFTGIAIHEILHALGFFHEQSRLDRDNYVTINWNNIFKGMEHNFQKHVNGEASDLNEPYDKKSLMHYGNFAFAVDYREMTIISKADPKEEFGQRYGLSKIDIRQLNKYYKCSDSKETKTTKSTITVTKIKTTKSTTTPTSKTAKVCIDTMTCCPALAANGLCSKSKWVEYGCKLSCNICPKTTTTTTTPSPIETTETITSTTPKRATTTTTTTTTETVIIDKNCKDKFSNCNSWAQRNSFCDHIQGCCVSSAYSGYMKSYCQKSCFIC